MSNAELFDALDLHAVIRSGDVRIHMDGDREAELIVEGPFDGGEVCDGQVFEFHLSGEQNGTVTELSFYIPVSQLESMAELSEGDS